MCSSDSASSAQVDPTCVLQCRTNRNGDFQYDGDALRSAMRRRTNAALKGITNRANHHVKIFMHDVLGSYGRRFSFAGPTGRGSHLDKPVRYQDCGVSKGDVCTVCMEKYTGMIEYMVSTKVWKQQAPTEWLVFR